MRITARAAFGAAVTVGLLAATSQSTPPRPAPPTGVWEAIRVNAKPLPMTDRVIGTDGFTHVIRLHSMTIRLRANGRFQAALTYRRAVLTKGEKIESQSLLNDTWIGTFTMRGNRFYFVPEPQAKQKVEPFEGVMAGRRITVGFDYDIVKRQHYVLDLDKNDNMY